MSTIKKITVVLEVEGNDKPLIASLGFQGFAPDTHDAVRLFEVLQEQAKDTEPQLKLNVTNEATKKEEGKA